MAKNKPSIREQIEKAFAISGGEVTSDAGRAGKSLSELVDTSYGSVMQVLRDMVDEGLIERQGSSRRIFRLKWIGEDLPHEGKAHISSSMAEARSAEATNEQSEFNYDELAAALLRRVVAVEKSLQEARSVCTSCDHRAREIKELKRTLQKTADQNSLLGQDLSEAKANLQDLERRLKAKQSENSALTEVLTALKNNANKQANGVTVSDLLDSRTREDLQKIIKERPHANG